METHFPRCVHCLAPMQSSGVTEALKSLLRRPVTCSACGKKVHIPDAQVMGETFGACVARFHQKLHHAVDTAPRLDAPEAMRVLGISSASRDAHHIHSLDELYRMVSRAFRQPLRHEATGHESLISVDMLHKNGASRAVKIHAARHMDTSPEVLVLIARVGTHDFLLYEVHSPVPAVAEQHAPQAHVGMAAKHAGPDVVGA